MFNDEVYRKKILKYVNDPVLISFWKNEFEVWNQKQLSEYILPIQNKVGQYLSSKITRNILGQVKSSFSFRSIMDNSKIFIANLSKGLIGEDYSNLLGSMLISKIQISAMERANTGKDRRNKFYLFVDEFQNFATDSFGTILSEARKYGLSITMANQYISQLNDALLKSVFGNVGSFISFQVGVEDAEYLEKEFNNIVTKSDIISLPRYTGYIRLLVDGMPATAFAFKTMGEVISSEENYSETIKSLSRKKYCKNKDVVEGKIGRFGQNK